jgi:hypothetical protein
VSQEAIFFLREFQQPQAQPLELSPDAWSIWRIGRPILSVKKSTSNKVPGTSAATCQAEICCARAVDACRSLSCKSTNVDNRDVNSPTLVRSGTKRSIAASASAALTSGFDTTATMSRASFPIVTALSVTFAWLVSIPIALSRCSMRRRSCNMIVRLSSLRNT